MTTATIAAAPEPREEPEQSTSCFTIGPIGNRLATVGSPALKAYEDSLEIYEKVIKPACGTAGIKPLRADGIAHSGEIAQQIFRHLLQDDIVIADVSGGNANVMYELGIRHGAGKPTIQIGEYDDLPFDISPIRTIYFTRSRSGLVDARNALIEALKAGMREGFDLSPAARIQAGLLVSEAEVALGQPPDDAGDEDVPGILDDMAAAEAGVEAMVRDMEEIGALLTVIGDASQRSTQEMDAVNRAGESMSARMSVVARYANSIKEPAADVERAAILFSERMATLDAGISAALTMAENTPPEERDGEVIAFVQTLVSVAVAAREGMEVMASFGATVDGIGRMSRYLRGPARSITSAVHHMGSAISCIDEWERRARALLD